MRQAVRVGARDARDFLKTEQGTKISCSAGDVKGTEVIQGGRET